MPGTSLQFNTGARIHEGGAHRCWWQLVVARGGSVEVGGRKERGASGADGDGRVEAVVFGDPRYRGLEPKCQRDLSAQLNVNDFASARDICGLRQGDSRFA
ncbi:hypothetical protein M0804_001987 [Polistes exclamans]|nr:hypothetical protein M0804_001987 [Polistes exclamans]